MNSPSSANTDERADWLHEIEKRTRRAKRIRLVLSLLSATFASVYIGYGCAGQSDCHKRGGIYVRESLITSACAEPIR